MAQSNTWRNRLTAPDANKIIEEISAKLRKHIADGSITIEQLNKINNLAANTGQLKNALTWLS